jgi:hypothetical protein
MKIYTAHWKYYTDDYYSPDNRKMFLYREDADKFLDDLINYDGVDKYYILEETVFDQYSPQTYYDYDYDDYYDGPGDEDWAVDEWSAHNDEQQYYKDQEMEIMFNVNNKHTICNESNNYSFNIGKNVINIDSYWFTSDEIEAFRVIWQRRISAM